MGSGLRHSYGFDSTAGAKGKNRPCECASDISDDTISFCGIFTSCGSTGGFSAL